MHIGESDTAGLIGNIHPELIGIVYWGNWIEIYTFQMHNFNRYDKCCEE